MALYDLFVAGFEGGNAVNLAGIGNGGVSAAPVLGTLFQGITAISQADALAQLQQAFQTDESQLVHVYLQSADGTLP